MQWPWAGTHLPNSNWSEFGFTQSSSSCYQEQDPSAMPIILQSTLAGFPFSFLERAGKHCSKREGAVGWEESRPRGTAGANSSHSTSSFVNPHWPCKFWHRARSPPPQSSSCPAVPLCLSFPYPTSIDWASDTRCFTLGKENSSFACTGKPTSSHSNKKEKNHMDAFQLIALERRAASMLPFQPDPFIYVLLEKGSYSAELLEGLISLHSV